MITIMVGLGVTSILTALADKNNSTRTYANCALGTTIIFTIAEVITSTVKAFK